MTLCTEKDSNFIEYKDKIENRKITFPIKEILRLVDCFLNIYLNLNIRDVVFLNVEKNIKASSFLFKLCIL